MAESAECLPIEELFKRTTKGTGATSTLQSGGKNLSPSKNSAKSKKRAGGGGRVTRIAKSPLHSKPRFSSPNKSSKKSKTINVKVKPEWNAYLTDDKKYKLSKNQLLDKKRSYVSPRQKVSSHIGGSIKHIPINLDTSSEALYEGTGSFNFNDEADMLIGKEIEEMEEALTHSFSKHGNHEKDFISPASQKRSTRSPASKPTSKNSSPTIENRPMWAVRATNSHNSSFLKPSPMKSGGSKPLSSHSPNSTTFFSPNKGVHLNTQHQRKKSSVKVNKKTSQQQQKKSKEDLFDSDDIDFHVSYNIDSTIDNDSLLLDKENNSISGGGDYTSSSYSNSRRPGIHQQSSSGSLNKENSIPPDDYSSSSTASPFFAVDYSLSTTQISDMVEKESEEENRTTTTMKMKKSSTTISNVDNSEEDASSSQFLLKEVVELTKRLNEVTCKVDEEREKRLQIESRLQETENELLHTKQALSRVSSPADSSSSSSRPSPLDEKEGTYTTSSSHIVNVGLVEEEEEDDDVPVYKILEQQIKRLNEGQDHAQQASAGIQGGGQQRQFQYMQREFENLLSQQAKKEGEVGNVREKSTTEVQPTFSHLSEFIIEPAKPLPMDHQRQHDEWYAETNGNNTSQYQVEDFDVVKITDGNSGHQMDSYSTDKTTSQFLQPQDQPQHPCFFNNNKSTTTRGQQQSPAVIRIPCVLPESEPATIYQQRETPPLPTIGLPSHPLAAVYAMKLPTNNNKNNSPEVERTSYAPMHHSTSIPQQQYHNQNQPQLPRYQLEHNNIDISPMNFAHHHQSTSNNNLKQTLSSSSNTGGRVIGEWGAPTSSAHVIPGSAWRVNA